MNTPIPSAHKGANHHPMLILAAIAVILFCLAGTAAIMGWLPSSIGSNPAKSDLSEADRAQLASQLQGPPGRASNSAPAAQPGDGPAPQAAYAPPVGQALHRPAQRPVELASNAPARNWCANCGNVESIREIHTRAQGSGLGAAGGAVLGGLLGNQLGGGHGRQLATVAGAVGGAVVGNQVEGNMKATHSYEIKVRLDDGSARTFHQQNASGWRTGERVKIVNGTLHPVG